jgi:hypothetical protein
MPNENNFSSMSPDQSTPAIPPHIKENFKNGEWKIKNTQPINLTDAESQQINNDPHSKETQDLLKQKGIEIGKGNFYRIGESVVSFDPEDVGTSLYNSYDSLAKELGW